MKNWAGNYEYRAAALHYPKNVADVLHIVRTSPRVKVLGTRHSFNDIADSPSALLSLRHLDRVVSFDFDAGRPTVTVEGGITYGQLCRELHRDGYALHNLASLPHISVAGACATATHGSGVGNANLASAVVGVQFVSGRGELVELNDKDHPDELRGAVVGLGGLGAVTALTLKLEPAFTVRQEVYENLPLAALKDHFEEIVGGAYSVSLFTDWRGDAINQVWCKRREGDAAGAKPDDFGAKAATHRLHPLAGMPAENCTEQLGIPGPWHQRLPHFRMEFTPSAGEELQSEYFVPHGRAWEAIERVRGLRDHVAPLLQISEVRTIAEDSLWMSPCCGRACVALHFTWKKDWPAVCEVLPKIEAALEPLNARPHWGKLFTMEPDRLQPLYEKLPDFGRLLGKYDPHKKFRNSFLDRYVYASEREGQAGD